MDIQHPRLLLGIGLIALGAVVSLTVVGRIKTLVLSILHYVRIPLGNTAFSVITLTLGGGLTLAGSVLSSIEGFRILHQRESQGLPPLSTLISTGITSAMNSSKAYLSTLRSHRKESSKTSSHVSPPRSSSVVPLSNVASSQQNPLVRSKSTHEPSTAPSPIPMTSPFFSHTADNAENASSNVSQPPSPPRVLVPQGIEPAVPSDAGHPLFNPTDSLESLCNAFEDGPSRSDDPLLSNCSPEFLDIFNCFLKKAQETPNLNKIKTPS